MAINAGSIVASLDLDTGKFSTKLAAAQTSVEGFAGKLSGYGEVFENIGKGLTIGVTTPIVGLGAVATKLGLDFQSAMSQVGAISGATGDDLAVLEQKARDMGATTKFSASDAADALKYMAMAGWETNAMLEGIDGVMALAAASGEDLGMVSDIVTDSMTAFGLQAKEAGHFADVLAKASSSSNTNVGLMGETFKYVAPLAGSLGYSIEDTALAVGLMANAGIKGSQSGTALRSMITRLIKPTKESGTAMDMLGITMTNTDGSMKSLSEVMVQLRDKFEDLNPEQQAFYAAQIAGQEAMSGFLSIVNASDGDFNKLQDNINNASGAAKDMSEMMQNNLKGRWEEFKSGLEEVALQIYDLLLPSLEKWLAKGQNFIDWFQSLDEGTKKTIINIAGLAAAAGPVLVVGGKMASGLGSIIGLFGKFGAGAKVATTAAGVLSGATGLGSVVATGTKAGGVIASLGGAAGSGGVLGGLTSGLGASLAAINPWIIGIGAAAAGGYALYKTLQEDTIPAFELFDETISESTKEALGSILDMEREATTSLKTLGLTGKEVSQEFYTDFTTNTNQMVDEVLSKLEEQKEEGLRVLGEYLGRQTEMTIEEKEEALRIATEKYDNEIQKVTEGKARIEEILLEAKENNTSITDEERIEIEKILEDLKETSIEIMTESQEEQEKILENLKNNADRITAEMMLEVIKNSREQKEKTIAEAEEQYEKTLDAAERLKKDGTAESKELADNMIAEAKRQKEDTIAEAEEMHEKVLSELEAQGSDIYRQIDMDNEKIKSKWDELKDWFARNPIVRKIEEIRETVREDYGAGAGTGWKNLGRNAHGTNYWSGGLSWVGEQGPEIVELPKGSKVHSNQQSMELLNENNRNQPQEITVNTPVYLDGKKITSVTSRVQLQNNRGKARALGVVPK